MNDIDTLAQEVALLVGKIRQMKMDPLRLDALLAEEYGADSMDMLEIVDAVENKYGISVTDDQVLEICTIRDIVAMIQAHRNANQPRG